MDDSIAAKHEPVAVVIRFNSADLYWLMLRQFFKFPAILWLSFTVGLIAFFDYRAGGFYYSVGVLVFIVGFLPGIQIFRMRKSPGVNSDTQHIFADSGISTVMGPVSNFAEWSYATMRPMPTKTSGASRSGSRTVRLCCQKINYRKLNCDSFERSSDPT
jgi:hypothetical protein